MYIFIANEMSFVSLTGNVFKKIGTVVVLSRLLMHGSSGAVCNQPATNCDNSNIPFRYPHIIPRFESQRVSIGVYVNIHISYIIQLVR